VYSSARRVFYIFLASPGDLQDERFAVKQVVDKLNQLYGRTIAWQVELLAWEDTLPEHGARPQEIINREVDQCDLFIGMLWRRWGSPTGQFSSGFEEEFERARGRFQREKKPGIWLFFKKVDLEQLDDPGEVLSKVIGFRRTRETAKDTLYKEFSDKQDLKDQIEQYLVRHILELALSLVQSAEAIAPASPTPQPGAAAAIGEEEAARPPEAAGTQQIGELLDSLIGATEAGSYADLTRAQIGRLFVLSGTLMSSVTGEVLAAHEVNVIYMEDYLTQLYRFQPRERELLMRTIIESRHDNKPGWFWFRGLNTAQLRDLLVYHATQGRSPDLRQRTLEIAASSRFALAGAEIDALEILMVDPSSDVRKAFMAYLGALGAEPELPLLERGLVDADEEVRKEATNGKLLVLSRVQPNQALRLLAETPVADGSAVLDSLMGNPQALNMTQLEQLLDSPAEAIRLFAVKALVQRDGLTVERARRLLPDPASRIVEVVVRELIKQGVSFEPNEIREMFKGAIFVNRDSILNDIFMSIPLERVEALVDWYSVDGPIAYRALVLRNLPESLERLRRDLQEEFATIKRSSIERLRVNEPPPVAAAVTEQFAKYDATILAWFLSEVLSVLAEHGVPADAEFVRRHLASGDRNIQREAIRSIRRVGDGRDIPALLGIVESDRPEMRYMAAESALHLSAGSREVTSALLESDAPEVLGLVAKFLIEHPTDHTGDLVTPLLSNSDRGRRLAAIRVVTETYTREQIENLLREYIQAATYYYNVVCWFDRILYSPSPLREGYAAELRTTLT